MSGEVTSYAGIPVLVTGADGFIGSHLTEALIAGGARVTALSAYNSFDRSGWLDDISAEDRSKVAVVRGDIRDAAFVRCLLRDQQIVFHLAALIAIPYSYRAPQSYVDVNVLGTRAGWCTVTFPTGPACRTHAHPVRPPRPGARQNRGTSSGASWIGSAVTTAPGPSSSRSSFQSPRVGASTIASIPAACARAIS